MKTTNKLKTIFGQITDFRCSQRKLYDLESILVIGIISVICGAESWNEMEDYALSKEDFLSSFLDLPKVRVFLLTIHLTVYCLRFIVMNSKSILYNGQTL